MIARTEAFRPAKADWAQAGLVALVLFILYAATAPRTVALEDDGLFILSSYFLGIEHPPGFPLHTLLGKLFTLLPFGSVAYRVHLLSALFGALSCGLLWLCARALIDARLPAYLAAFALGLSPVFWSQSLIAEVYTLNTFFFALLVLLGLRACPPSADAPASPVNARVLPLMAFLFGLSLSNHWPLMLLVAPAFAILLWPARGQLLGRLGGLSWLAILGLVPYLWMIRRSWMPLPISFDGPLVTFQEIWFFLSRDGYRDVDQSASASWLDRIRFFQFFAGQLFFQFAVAGALLAAAGFWIQHRVLGKRLAAFLTVAFLMPSAVLLLLLRFDYGSVSKHVFHVYPLPAYAVAALWMGLGFAWLIERLRLRASHAAAAGTALLALILAVGSRSNLLANHDWGARYAQAVLRTLPKDAIVFVRSDGDLAPLAYFHLIENVRPDITLYHAGGLVLGNRLFHPLRTSIEDGRAVVRKFIESQSAPVVFTSESYSGNARIDRWLHVAIDKSSSDPRKVSIDIPEEAIRFFEESILGVDEPNAWIAFQQHELRRRYALLFAQRLQGAQPLDARSGRHLAALSQDFYGALGMAEGLMVDRQRYSAGTVGDMLNRARDLMPSDVIKPHRSSYFYLRGALRIDLGDRSGGIEDFETALFIWPSPDNRALSALEDLYRTAGDERALTALQLRVKRPE